ncbi:hypothetical protein BC835DRAFT_843698 [Cytidiella melzeri]|nr:hypothetical protein BC835DRAFT_843698 [Cytidiella melzeri]
MSSQPLHELHDSSQQSPIVEEDISRVGVFAYPERGASPTTKTDKQREKQRDEGPFSDSAGDEDSSEEADERRESYPPLNDEAEESRRVEENLRQWEIAERQRRKAARESTSTVASTSLVGDVTKRASLLWTGKRSRPPVQGLGTHHIVPTTDEGVAMDDFENDTAMVMSPDPENPFRTPMASTVSLNTPGDSAIMTEISDTSTGELSDSPQTPTNAESQKYRSHPPPQPLDLPKPKSPPPHTVDIHEEELPDKRWWTDWLCGCRDRHGDQAARTNPFE